MGIYDKQPMPCNDQSDQALVVQAIISLKKSLNANSLSIHVYQLQNQKQLFHLEKCENLLLCKRKHKVTVYL